MSEQPVVVGSSTDSSGTPTQTSETGSGLPPGGNTGQVIVKNSGTDYDARWADSVRVHVGPVPPEDTSMVWIDTNG